MVCHEMEINGGGHLFLVAPMAAFLGDNGAFSRQSLEKLFFMAKVPQIPQEYGRLQKQISLPPFLVQPHPLSYMKSNKRLLNEAVWVQRNERLQTLRTGAASVLP